jgi:hypothetical protein
MRSNILKYINNHNGFCPSFTVIFTGSKAVVSIKHKGTDRNVGHQEAVYGIFFWFRLLIALRRCYKLQTNQDT